MFLICFKNLWKLFGQSWCIIYLDEIISPVATQKRAFATLVGSVQEATGCWP